MAPKSNSREISARTEGQGKTSEQSPARSMTGFGSATAQLHGISLTAIIRSVNHRHMDLRMHLPEWLLPLEPKARNLLQGRNARGHIELRITTECSGGTGISVDEALVARYLETFSRLGSQYGIGAQADAATLLQLPGVVTRRELAVGVELTTELESLLLATLESAISSWDQMRAQEASVLAEDMHGRLQVLREIVARMEAKKTQILRMAQARLTERLKALSEQAGIDPSRLAQEASMLADRTDVSEEIVRLKAHVEHFQEILASAPDAGRKLDFLLQEMNRETNTMLAKIAGLGEVSLEMTTHGLEAKVEIEKLREQIQNLQ